MRIREEFVFPFKFTLQAGMKTVTETAQVQRLRRTASAYVTVVAEFVTIPMFVRNSDEFRYGRFSPAASRSGSFLSRLTFKPALCFPDCSPV